MINQNSENQSANPQPASGQKTGANTGHVILENISKGYGEEWDWAQIIENMSLELPTGKLTAVVGPSGCGKSTLVNLIAGFEKPDSGQITIDGAPITGPSKDRIVVFQETALMPWLTTYQNTIFGPRIRGDMSEADIERDANALLDKVGLTEFKEKYPIQLSGGMQRRAELARALMNKPKVLIMDEPFRGLDAMTRELMQEFFLRLFEETGSTNLFVTSEIEEAVFLADRLIILSNTPTCVKEIILIDLPRPREPAMMGTEQAYEYKKQAMEILHVEAMKSFGGQSSEEEAIRAAANRI